MLASSQADNAFDHKFQLSNEFNYTNDTHEDSFTHDIEAQKEYVNRLKIQRQKIESLYNKYDVLLTDLKNKDSEIKDKTKLIQQLDHQCHTLQLKNQEFHSSKTQIAALKAQNINLREAFAQLQNSYVLLHNHLKSAEITHSKRVQQLSHLNEQLTNKIKIVHKSLQQKEEQYDHRLGELKLKIEESGLQSKKQKDSYQQQINSLRATLLNQQEENNILKVEIGCLRQRLAQLDQIGQEQSLCNQQVLQQLKKERRNEAKMFRLELQSLKQLNLCLQKKVAKGKEDCHQKDLTIADLNSALEELNRKSAQTLFLNKQQFAQQKSLLKEQIIYSENHIAKLQRKLSDCLKNEKRLFGKIQKFENCFDAKRSLRELEKEQLQKINILLKSD